MTFTEAAAEVLRLAGKPLHYKEITEVAIEKNLLSHVGKSPEVTMGARLAALLKKEDKGNPIVRVKPGVFALREWGKKGDEAASDDGGDDVNVNALEVEAAAAAKPPTSSAAALAPGGFGEDEEDEDDEVSGDDALRADLAASGADMFDDEEDDDQPILAGPAPQASAVAGGAAAGPPQAADGGPGEGGGRRRRRRRRRRGGGLQPQNGESFGREATSPSITPIEGDRAIPADASVDGQRENVMRDGPIVSRPVVRDRQQIMSAGAQQTLDHALPEGDELAGRDLADAALVVLSAFDRNAGPVPIRSVVEHLVRRGRLGGDPALASTQLSASLRADNLRRGVLGQRARFRFASGSRVAPTEWLLGSDLVRLEQDVMIAVDRYREGARRTFLRRVQELPGHSFVELALVALERIGMTQVAPGASRRYVRWGGSLRRHSQDRRRRDPHRHRHSQGRARDRSRARRRFAGRHCITTALPCAVGSSRRARCCRVRARRLQLAARRPSRSTMVSRSASSSRTRTSPWCKRATRSRFRTSSSSKRFAAARRWVPCGGA